MSYMSFCHHPHISFTRLPIVSQQLYLATLQHNLTLAILIIHLFHNTPFYSLISNSTNNPLALLYFAYECSNEIK
ncbi:hypothetical protein BCR42DRAFT_421355 [Absidia repens]|uniref:Uncharacterized protein n=1 Tax=Absidia repens TaxID=90262 RepID=A0A1X2I8Q9_9FUNG|nr:hypothetical protein BCR42DRAFT_421355 [Absidia repens]